MKYFFTRLFACAMLLILTACGATPQTPPATEATKEEPGLQESSSETTELIVFAAASMTETLTRIKELYEADHPGVTITYNFDSSGTLTTQIQEGADCDIFISAGQKQMDQLDSAADTAVNTEGLDLILTDSRIDLLENKIALVLPEGNPAAIESFEDLAQALKDHSVLMAMGNSDVPVGQYTQKILAYYELSEEELAAAGTLTYGTNVKEVTTQVAEGAVDCGIVYGTDAFSAGLTVADTATKDMCGQVIYPAAVLKNSGNPDLAGAFLSYLTDSEAMAIFEEVGFSAVK